MTTERSRVASGSHCLLFLCLPLLALLLAGCATPNVNPPQARANTGYVDWYADSAAELNWDVARFDERTQSFSSVFSELKVPQAGILRLAFAPGRHRLRVTFLNRVITKPAVVEVEVLDGKVTPVSVTLTEAGTTQVKTKNITRGVPIYGRYRRSTKIGSDESVMYSVSAEASSPIDYQLKERMSYAR